MSKTKKTSKQSIDSGAANSPAFTAGPWKIGYGAKPGDHFFTVVGGPFKLPICDFSMANYKEVVTHGMMVANARLIAAAPDLLSNLIQVAQCLRMSLLNVSDRETRELGIEIVMDAQRAIAKAGGA